MDLMVYYNEILKLFLSRYVVSMYFAKKLKSFHYNENGTEACVDRSKSRNNFNSP